MISETKNRISDVMDDGPPVTIPRTEAQREASRRNGRKSCGPTTEAGKAESRSNAVKHGLLARIIKPPGDVREHDLLYRRIRMELLKEFEPARFSHSALIDAAAQDFLQLARARAMVESLQQPTMADPEFDEKGQLVHERRQLGRLLAAALDRLDDSLAPASSARRAAKLAALIKELVEQIIEEAGNAADENLDELEDYDRKEVEELRELNALVYPARRKLTDLEDLRKLLLGTRAPKRREMKRLRILLAYLNTGIVSFLKGYANLEAAINKRAEKVIKSAAWAPDRLMLLNRYIADIERGIERKLRRLERIVSLGFVS